jgi:type VI secretion system secreted protein VgrG
MRVPAPSQAQRPPSPHPPAPGQAQRPLILTAPPGAEALQLVGFTGVEAVSQCFSFHLDLLAPPRQAVRFDQLLGKPFTVSLAVSDGRRYFSGVCNAVSQGEPDQTGTRYRVQLVPKLWFFTKRVRSRMFQRNTVPEILRAVLGERVMPEILTEIVGDGADVVYELEEPHLRREYCVQYRESDFAFASRLLEEEGLYYYFTHTARGHQLVVTDKPLNHPPQQPSRVQYERVLGGRPRGNDRVYSWEKCQEVRAGRVVLWDRHFELPGTRPRPYAFQNLESPAGIAPPEVPVGGVAHAQAVAGNQDLELFDYPGEFAHHFDRVGPGGQDQTPEFNQGIYGGGDARPAGPRTAAVRMQQEALPGLLLKGTSNCGHFASGHRFVLDASAARREPHAPPELAQIAGEYVLTSVHHSASQPAEGRSNRGPGYQYSNSFTCIPAALPLRPLRVTPKPVIYGTQTAVVVGPAANETWVDRYGRVKVQFPWDREGQYDAAKACWVRVAQVWAGKGWGAFFWPRVGQEVVIVFEEGDPDRPLVIGSVYNDHQPVPYALPEHVAQSGIKTCSTGPGPAGRARGFNELRFDDRKDHEQVFLHAQRNLDVRVNGSSMTTVGGSHHLTVGGQDEDGTLHGDAKALVYRDLHCRVKRDERTFVERHACRVVNGHAFEDYLFNHITTTIEEEVVQGRKILLNGSEMIALKAPTILLDAGQTISIKGPGGHIVIDAAGVTIHGAPFVQVNSGGSSPLSAPPHTVPRSHCPHDPEAPAGADGAQGGYPSNS